MKVALLVPPSPFLFDPMTFPPLGVLHLSSFLKRQACDVTVYDYNDFKERARLAGNRWSKVENADVVGITGTTPQFSMMVHLLNLVKGRCPGPKFYVAGGPHASCDPSSCIQAGFDAVVAGDGEFAFADAIDKKVPGIYNQFIRDLNILPFPDRSAINIKRYHYKIDGEEATSIITQRGCPYSCAFCCHWQGYQKTRCRSTQNVVEELDELYKLYGYEAFMIWDDEFNLDRKRTIELCQALKPLDIKFRCFIRSNLFDAEVAQAMKDAGCVEVGCGVESGSQRILNNIHKGTTVEENTQARKLCRMLGIRFKAFTIVGNAGEDLESINETREWLRKNEPDDFDATINTPYPGSPEWEHPEQFDLIFDKEKMKKSLYEGTFYKGPPSSPVATEALSAETIVRLRDKIEDEFGRKTKSRDLWKDKRIEG